MKSVFLGILAFHLSALTIGGAQASEPFLLKPLDHGAWGAIDNPAAKADESGANAGFVVGSDAVLVVDTFENPAAAQKLLGSSAKDHGPRAPSWPIRTITWIMLQGTECLLLPGQRCWLTRTSGVGNARKT